MTTGAIGDPNTPTRVVGVGASAGGLDACKALLANVAPDSGLAFIVVLHLDPARASRLAEVLTGRDGLPVTQVTEPQRLEANHVYVIAPNTSLNVEAGELRPAELPERHGVHTAVDLLFASLAKAYGPKAVAVVLSGLGSDGASALSDIKAAGGLCIAQDPDTAQHDAMPRAAIATQLVDAVLPPESIASFVLENIAASETAQDQDQGRAKPAPDEGDTDEGDADEGDAEGFAGILRLLTAHHGLELRDYKKGTLRRRAERRRALMQFAGWSEYLAYLQEHLDELAALYQDVLVGVTRFFRDPEQWEYLEREIIPSVLDEQRDQDGVRAWVAGCATGEEAYSLAMVLTEQLERRGQQTTLRVFATDISQNALTHARRGVYPASIADHVGPERLARFFSKRGDTYQIIPQLRDTVTLARHNLLTEPPFSRLDFVSCRNLFIYLEPHAQHECLQRFYFGLRGRGVLWLGSSESISRNTELFSTISSKYRVYRKSDILQPNIPSWTNRAVADIASVTRRGASTALRSSARITRSLEEYVLRRHTAACVVINEAGQVLHMFGPATDYLVPPTGEVRLDLLAWARDSILYAKLRTALTRALAQHEGAIIAGIPFSRDGEPVRVEIAIEPIPVVAEGLFLVSFRDEPQAALKPSELPAPEPESVADESLLRRLAKQLQDTQTELQTTLEDLDSANEEYRASYEELVSLNEELQSSNEELETTKEEAQSINEELLTVNRELEDRNQRLHTVNADLENLLALTTIPTVFLDRQLRVRRFTPAAERVMRLVATDVGRPAQHIQKRVDDERMFIDAAEVLETLTPREAEVRAEEGRWYLRRIVPFRSGDRIEGVCLTFYDMTSQKLAAEESEEARHYVETIAQASSLPFVVLDHERVVVSANDIFHRVFATTGRIQGARFFEVDGGRWDIPAIREIVARTIREGVPGESVEFEHSFADLGVRHLRLNASSIERPNRLSLVLLSIEDVTMLHDARDTAIKRQELEAEHRRKDEFLAMLGHELRNPLAALVNGLALLDEFDDDAAQVRRLQPMLVRQTRRMTVILDQLLDISRVSSGKIELDDQAIDLVDVANTVIESVRPMIDASHHEFVLSLPPAGTVFVRGDLVRLTQVVENLLANAVKYTEEGGTIWLMVDASERTVRIVVRDTGIGIDAELLGRIFEVFTQGSQSLGRSRGGLGVGLALVRLLVNLHGGRVEAFSAGTGRGSEFVVHLPRLEPESVTVERAEQRRSTGLAVPTRRVLVVDDELDAALMLAELLKLHGHEVRVAHDGHTALEVAGEWMPEVVLLDLGLPDIDGYEVARRLRTQVGAQAGAQVSKSMRIVAVTGYQREDTRLQAAGFDDHVLKPPTLDRLVVALEHPA
jgi:two-component system, chemotaxis family, CheB/CheR fusion protein